MEIHFRGEADLNGFKILRKRNIERCAKSRHHLAELSELLTPDLARGKLRVQVQLVEGKKG
jgi:hypothetical protein